MEDGDGRRELAVRTSAAALTGLAGLLGPDPAAIATTLSPAMEMVLSHVATRIRQRWNRNAAEALGDAAEASGESPEDLLLKAVADDRRHELLARALGVAQDTALREKRRALGRALAAGIAGDDARVDDELLFIRAVADIDEPHIRLLALMASETPLPGKLSGSVFHGGWSPGAITARDPGFGDSLPALMWTLESHGLIGTETSSTPWQSSRVAFTVTQAGRQLLDRLTQNDQAL
ncbi:MAG: hypothetical protein ACM32E_28175 [Gemmatimonadota bacterium]